MIKNMKYINQLRVIYIEHSLIINTLYHKVFAVASMIFLREYEPASISTNKVSFYFHGGGYFLGDVITHDWCVSTIANILEAIFFSLHYRLSP